MISSFRQIASIITVIFGCGLGRLASGASHLPDLETPDGHVDIYYSHRGSGPAIPDKNIGNEILYQIVVDRFANGNRNNDCLYNGRFCARNQNFKWYHYFGGDLRGIINNVDYIKDLGVTRLWLTPIFENQNVVVETYKYDRWVYPTSYHGYWIRDWFRLNPMFTDNGTKDYDIVSELIDKAKPIRIYLDTVANHTSPADATPESLNFLNSIEPINGGGPNPHRGALFRDGNYITGFDEDRAKTQSQAGYRSIFHQQDRKITNWSDPWEVYNLQLDRLVDLDQTNPDVREYMDDAHSFWMEKFPGIAGFRIDTIKHVPQSYWRAWSESSYQKFPRMESFGEYWDAGSLNSASHPFYKDTRFSMLDFDFRRALLATLGPANRPFTDITAIWKNDPSLNDATQLITFLDNHDFPRARGLGMSRSHMRQALALLMTSRGIPCLYYGMEQDLYYPNDPGDPFNRPMMESFDTESSDFKFLQKLIQVRKTNLAARYGVTHVVHETDNILAFERIYGSNYIFVATSKNKIPGSDDFDIEGVRMPNGTYTDLISGKVYTIAGGKIRVSMYNGDVIILDSKRLAR